VANSGGSDVSRLDNNGNLIAVIPVGSTPTGLAVDADGKVWVTNYSSHSAMRIDPSSNAVDLTVNLGPGAYPYNYSDMTGSTLTAPPDVGTWTVIHDSFVADQDWGSVAWNAALNGGTIMVTAASSTDAACTTFGPAETVTSGADLTVADGQCLQITVQFDRSAGGQSPVLFDLTIEAANNPPVAECTDLTLEAGDGCEASGSIDNGSYDPDGDPFTVVEEPLPPWPLGDTEVTLTITDDSGESDTCTGIVTVEDTTDPAAYCNSPDTIIPPDAPISFTATTDDFCGSTVEVTGYDCWAINGAGKRISKLESCVVSFTGDTVTIEDSGGVGDNIEWFLVATDTSGNTTEMTCALEVVRKNKK
jgi:hypothetical protein